jgi:hypothetical protein
MEVKKKLKEVIALYKLEKTLTDIFVEGPSDKVFFQNYLKTQKKDRTVIPIEIIDFTELAKKDNLGLDMKSNRNKLIVFSEILKNISPTIKIRCIIDKDFDDYLDSISNNQLLRTDFSCLESYLFCKDVVEKFLDIAVGNFPITTDKIIDELSKVLKPIFAIRLLKETNFKGAKLIKIDGNLKIDKKTGDINFNEEEYLNKFINSNNLVKNSKFITEKYREIMNSFTLDIRNYMQGHDFITIFYLYINKIKNTKNFKEDQIDKILFLTVESTSLNSFELFKNILTD